MLNCSRLHLPPPEEVCRDLTAVGHALFLPNKQDPSQSWLILDLQAILHNVYGTLFSPGPRAKSTSLVSSTAVNWLSCFPSWIKTMIQEVLISLEFCIQVDTRMLMRGDLLKLTAKVQREMGGCTSLPWCQPNLLNSSQMMQTHSASSGSTGN